MSAITSPDLADENLLRRIAFDLLGDPDLTAEALQLTRITAARKAPRDPAATGSWLRRIARNRALRLREDRARRERMHRDAGREREWSTPATIDVVARDELAALIEDAVARLDQPFRDIVRLRYFDRLPPREIASRRGIPVATVHSRLQRALLKMRGDLDRRSDPQHWRAVLAPLVVRPSRTAMWSVWFSAAAVLLAAIGATVVLWSESGTPTDTAGKPGGTVGLRTIATASGEAHARDEHPAAAKRTLVPEEDVSQRRTRRRALPVMWVTGDVRDERGRPVAGASILCGRKQNRLGATGVTSDESGHFSVRFHRYPVSYLAAAAPGYRASHAAALTVPPPKPQRQRRSVVVRQHATLYVVRGGMVVRGRVTAPDGTPLEHASVFAGRGHIEHMPTPADSPSQGRIVISTTTDQGGYFEMVGVATGSCHMVAVSTDHGVAHTTVTGDAGDVMTVDLQLIAGAELIVHVLEADTAIPVDARVVYAPAGPVFDVSEETDNAGLVNLYPLPAGRDCLLRIEAIDGRRKQVSARGPVGATQEITVWLPSLASTTTTRGTVHLSNGEPLHGGLVRLRSATDPTLTWTVETQENGFFAVASGPEQFDLEVLDEHSPGELPLLFLRGLQRSDVDLSLDVDYSAEAGELRGRLIREDGGHPERIDLRLQHESRAMSHRIPVDQDGEFDTSDARPGVYELVAITPSGARCDLSRVELQRGVDHDLGTVTLPLLGTVEVGTRGSNDPASTFVVRNARGIVVVAGRGPLPARTELAPGGYRIERDGELVHEVALRAGETIRL